MTDPTQVDQATLPLVTVAIPVFNGEPEISRAIECILQQDYPNIEILVSDNASTDKTQELVCELASQHSQIKYRRNAKNIGSFLNFTQVFDQSNATYFMWFGHHDQLTSSFIRKAVEIMESDTSVVLCYPNWSLAYPDGTTTNWTQPQLDTRGYSRVHRFLTLLWGVQSCIEFYGLHRRTALQAVLPFQKIFAMDCLLLCKLSAIGAFARIPSERFFAFTRPWDDSFVLQTARRHGIAKINATTPIVQFLRVAYYFIASAASTFPKTSERFAVMPSLLLSLLVQYSWVYVQLKKGLESEKAQRTRSTESPTAVDSAPAENPTEIKI